MTPAAVLDTDVLSFFAKGDSRANLYAPELAGRRWAISFQTVAELRLWAMIRRWGSARQAALDALLSRMVVIPYDARMAQHWAEVIAHRRRIGRPIECGDAWIAATAIRYQAPLLTHNADDFTEIADLEIIMHARIAHANGAVAT